jgi:hypothetical protein
MKRLGSVAGVMLVFLLSALALVMIYDKGKDQKPLRYADVPQETIDWINSFGEGIDDILSSFDPLPRPTPWNNDGDVGQDPKTGMKTLEDEYFIFYFPESMAKQASLCQQLAHQAIPHLEDIIGKYYYPSDMNGRKVPIYLTPDQKAFNELMAKMFSGKRDYGTTAGITISSISPSGYFLDGIALNGKFAFSNNAYTKNVLWHEMTHYCFFASVDYNQQVNLPMWCYEGIAEYTSLPGEKPRFSNQEIEMMKKDCKLTDSYFPYVFENYQGGQSIFCYMDNTYSVSGVKNFLKTTYTKGIPAAMQSNFSKTLLEFEADWKTHLSTFKRGI